MERVQGSLMLFAEWLADFWAKQARPSPQEVDYHRDNCTGAGCTCDEQYL